MYSYADQCIMDLSDNYTLLYSFLGRSLISRFGKDGERALREATRRYGRDRGETLRKKHEALGVKVNMQSLFTICSDLPPDPRFRRELQELNPEERVSHTLFCPMSDIWRQYGERYIGRIYCEEFHPACYCHYAFDYGRANLSMTLTQEEDDYCNFNVVLRAENLPDSLKPRCFAEYDPGYSAPKLNLPPVDGKKGFECISVKIYYYILETSLEYLGNEAIASIAEGLQLAAKDASKRAQKTASNYKHRFDRDLIYDTYPLTMDRDKTTLWSGYTAHRAVELFEENFVATMEEELHKNE